MRAYYTHNNAYDSIVIPGAEVAVTVTDDLLREYLEASPNFSAWRGESTGGLLPEDYGRILAIRDDDASQPNAVYVTDWRQWLDRLNFYEMV